jgi:hypothetical protein
MRRPQQLLERHFRTMKPKLTPTAANAKHARSPDRQDARGGVRKPKEET